MSKITISLGGKVTILGLLGIVFVVLKLTGHISWSWWWVTLPFWGPMITILCVLFVLLIIALIVDSYK